MSGNKKILYIDDEEINLQLFKHIFSKKYDIITEYCGLDGLNTLKIIPDIKVIICDMKMPNMNGLEFVTKAKHIYNDKIYFILSGYDITDEIKMAIESKLIEDYFRKPFNIVAIETEIDKVMNKF